MTTKQKLILEEAVGCFLNKEDTNRRRFSLLYLGCMVDLAISSDFYTKPNSDNRTLAIKTLSINSNYIAIVKTVSNRIFVDNSYCDPLSAKFRGFVFKEITKQAGENYTINEDNTGERLRLIVGSIYHKNRYYELMNERMGGGG